MINIVLFEPEIPQNTGNIIRLAANTGATLHLVKPFLFSLEDKRLRRAGLDYHEYAGIKVHEGWEEFKKSTEGSRLFGMSTKAKTSFTAIEFQRGDFLIFGPETRGLPDPILEELGINNLFRIPMLPHSRSLNLSNAVAITLYEAWRMQDFVNGV
ncbi:tRNA (uridine(34)/cytosine(34)/5-carboxymethylaminomethyluridine(34)-2'-O)-methyltransferase TrmL [Gammaproteobacteria bacterium]|nr:tRNA (uridine(34)/cytosine(34)/5-carboxymethylaminomethyluridine(34)-2'-O)-methyltransferase TrmL [Gammaproteobacteria bacterium]